MDVIAVLTESKEPRRYWSDLKIKLKNEGNESYDKIVQLKMIAAVRKKSILHVRPELLAYYPAPLEHSPDMNIEERYETLQHIAVQKLDTAFSIVDEDNFNKKSSSNVVKFGDAYQFTEDELNLVMRRRHSGSSYPEEAKDRNEYVFYEENGFKEVGDSRLLYKYIE